MKEEISRWMLGIGAGAYYFSFLAGHIVLTIVGGALLLIGVIASLLFAASESD